MLQVDAGRNRDSDNALALKMFELKRRRNKMDSLQY
jgi:hypothetical protein